MPFFSIIIPLYNKEQFISNTLKSVLAQTFTDFEVIVVNDGSTDGSELQVQAFTDARIHYYLRENKGVAAARNFGIALANAPYIAFLDADDYWYPDFLQQMHRNIKRFTTESVFAAAFEIETAKNVFAATYSIAKTAAVQVVDFFDASSKEAVIWTSASVFHKKVFDKSGFFDHNVRFAEDTDLWIRIGLEFNVVFDWKVLARYVYDQSSVSRALNYSFEASSFSKYELLEQQHPKLKKFLDLNRFSVAIKSKLAGDRKNFQRCCDAIDFKNLTLKKRILLHLPKPQLQILLGLKTYMAEIGLGNSVFK